MVGKTIGKYRFISKLGRGGMGTVYKAVDETLDREVAIKILNPEFADRDVMKRFRAEASMLAKLNHPAIATIYELHRSDDDLLMVMEFVRGESLDQFVQRVGPIEPERAAYLLAQVLDAIGHAHAAGIIHRDLKPSNVMVTESGTAKIMDFGIARVRGAEHMTTDGYMMGTPAYMSPEQVLCHEVDGRSDLYAVGVMFYRLLTGKLPFEADTAFGMVQKQISDAPTPARLHRAELPAWTLTILDRTLAKSPADRYQTAEELRRALLDANHGGTAEATTLLSSAPLRSKTTGHDVDPHAETSIATVAVPQPAEPATVARQHRVEPKATTPVAQVSRPIKPAGTTGTAKRKKPKPAAAKSKKNTFAIAAALVAIVTIGALAIGITAWRQSRASSQTTAVSADATASAPSAAPPSAAVPPAPPKQETAAPPVPSPAPVPLPPAATPVDTAATAITTAPASPTGTPVTAAPTRPARAARSTPPPPSEPAPEPAAPPVVAAPAPKEVAAPIQFLAKILVKDNDKPRERDATVRLAEGQVTVTAQDRTILSALPYDAVLSVIYSKSKQPLWDAPGGAVPIQRLEGGAFGFLKGGRHWVSLRTKERFIVLRVEENQVPSVLSAIEERTGKTTVRVAEPKGSQ